MRLRAKTVVAFGFCVLLLGIGIAIWRGAGASSSWNLLLTGNWDLIAALEDGRALLRSELTRQNIQRILQAMEYESQTSVVPQQYDGPHPQTPAPTVALVGAGGHVLLVPELLALDYSSGPDGSTRTIYVARVTVDGRSYLFEQPTTQTPALISNKDHSLYFFLETDIDSLWVIDPSTLKVHRVTSDTVPGYDRTHLLNLERAEDSSLFWVWGPVWLDPTRIAYSSNRTAYPRGSWANEIWVIDTATGRETLYARDDGSLAVHVLGEAQGGIVYRRSTPEGLDIGLATSDGRVTTLVAGVDAVSLGRSGRYLAYVKHGDPSRITILELETRREMTTVAEAGMYYTQYADFSPSEKHVLLKMATMSPVRYPVIMDLSTGHTRVLELPTSRGTAYLRWLDDHRIMATIEDPTQEVGGYSVWVINLTDG
jgi:hypothetical protein